jgi:hypothetical protein
MRYLTVALALAGTALLPACETSDTPHLDAQLGKSVAHMIEAQTYDPRAATDPPALAPEVGDGERLKNAVDASRKDVGTGTQSVEQQHAFDAGKQQ